MKSSNIKYLPAVDQLRGLAVVLIIFYHGLQLISSEIKFGTGFSYDHWVYPNNPLLTIFSEGHTAVALFMVLSGFIFTIGSFDKELIYTKFIKNRFLRIFPLFLFLSITSAYIFKNYFTLLGFLQSIFFMHNLPGALETGSFTTMFWAISVEFQFYLIFPFLIRFSKKSGIKYLLAVIVLFILFRTIGFMYGANIRDLSYWTILGRMDQFLIGIIIGILYLKFSKNYAEKYMKYAKLLLLPCITLILFVFYYYSKFGGWPLDSGYKIIVPTVEGLLWAGFILVYIPIFNRKAIFLNGLVRLGEISFSIYLLHYLVIDLVIKKKVLLTYFGIDVIDALITTSFIVVPLTVLLSAFTYTIIEKPFLDLREKYHKEKS